MQRRERTSIVWAEGKVYPSKAKHDKEMSTAGLFSDMPIFTTFYTLYKVIKKGETRQVKQR